MIRRIIIIALIIVVIYGGIKWFEKNNTKIPAAASASSALSVTVISPKIGSVTEQLNVTGVTISREEILVIPELSGVRVNKIFADVGDVVKKGQRLATLDGESLNNQLIQLQSDYDRAVDEFTRIDIIKNTGAVSRESVISKRTVMQAAKARLDDAQLNLKRSAIIAPEDGLIFERKAALGALVNASEPLFRMASKGEIEVEANIAESDLSSIKIGEDVSVQLTGVIEPVQGKIRIIAPRIDKISRTANIRITIPNDISVPIGLFANASIITSEKQGIILPATSIQRDSKGSFIWKIDASKKVARLPVAIKIHDNDFVIVEDISTDILVVARAGAFLKEGDAVNLVEGN